MTLSTKPIKEYINELNTEVKFIRNEQIKETVRKRKEKVENHPLKDYGEFVVKTVAEKVGLTMDQIKGCRRFPRYVMGRYIALSIINDNTDFKDYSTVFIDKDRTIYYNMLFQLEGLLIMHNAKGIFEELKALCSLSAYNRKDSVNNI